MPDPEHTINSVTWKRLDLREALLVQEEAHRTNLPDLTTWMRRADVMLGVRSYDVDVDQVNIDVIMKIDQALKAHRQLIAHGEASLPVPGPGSAPVPLPPEAGDDLYRGAINVD